MIVVAGEALVDLLVAPDGTVRDAVPGGGPFTTARAIARLGGEVAFLGALSSDAFGSRMRTLLSADGVALALPEPVAEPTTLAIAELDDAGRATYRFHVAATSSPRLRPADLDPVRAILGRGGAGRTLHVGTLGLVLEPMASTLAALVAEADEELLVVLDPNCRPALIPDPDAYRSRIGALLRRADLVKASDEDLAFLDPARSVTEAVARILDAGVRAVVVTAGGAPATLHLPGRAIELPVPRVAVTDTVGAGDTFGGAFVAWWAAAGLGRDDLADPAALEAAGRAAVVAAAIACERAGAVPPLLSELVARGIPWPAAPR